MNTERESPKTVVIITGMSGSGKHTAFKAFEDLGYFCVDNLPIALIPRLLQMTMVSGGKISKVALVVDARLGESLGDFKRLFARLKEMPLQTEILFFDAAERTLVQRYSETRRVHPLARGGSLLDGFKAEKARLAEIRTLADRIIETTEFSVHDLRNFIYERFRRRDSSDGLSVSLVSFGFKRGLPSNADLVFDMRFLPNPNFVSRLKHKTGNDRAVVEYLENHPETGEILAKIEDMLEYLLPKFAEEGKSYCTVGIGCTGGRHRSVMIASELKKRLMDLGYDVNLVHRDMYLE